MASPAELNPQPLPPSPPDRVRIFVNREIAYDLKKMTHITASVLGKLGCGGCHSGRILNFHIIEDFVVNPKTLDVHELPGGMG